ncbi:DUF2306 domain-containing protein [Lentibacter sp.]|uniref:DUF2306 domain-containing protein n=1 Tax=Lentibacter sp. TaxID=2024994 RepID=UPI003F6C544D
MKRFVPLALFILSAPVILGSFERLALVLQQMGQQDAPWIDQRYADHPGLSFAHILVGLVFFLLGPLQFWEGLRRRARGLHKLLGKLFIASGLVSGIAVIAMVVVFPAVGGLLTQVATTIIVLAMIGFLFGAYQAARHKQFVRHRAMMIRAYALGLSVSTARIFIELAEHFAAISFEDSFTLASAIGVGLNIVVAETWLKVVKK